MSTPTTPLEQALNAWNATQNGRDEVERHQIQLDRAYELADWGIFSNWNIANITGLNIESVAAITGKKDKTGGRLNPESLSLILDLWIEHNRHHRRRDYAIDRRTLVAAVNLGTSCAMIAKLTGIGRSRLYAIVQKEQS